MAKTGVCTAGTFSYITGMGDISVISVVGTWVGMALLCLAKNQWQGLAGGECLAIGSACGSAAFSRGPIAIGTFMILAWVLSSHASAYAALLGNGFGMEQVGELLRIGAMSLTTFEMQFPLLVMEFGFLN